MTRGSPLSSRPLWQVRWAARVPKAALAVAVAILSAAGLRSALARPADAVGPARRQPVADLGAESFAEAFARAYLSWDPGQPERNERRVSAFTSDTLETGAGPSVEGRLSQAVVWTAVAQDRVLSNRRHLITVATETTRGAYYLSVPVEKDVRGFLSVSGHPALVGPPAANRSSGPRAEPDVEDPQLEDVARRAVTNYLGREISNLRSDLDAHAVVALPPLPFKVTSIDALTWAGPGRVAVELEARGAGAAWSLRYELAVVRRGRWYVRSIQTNPNERSSR
jgi:hypothetical protein